jgi:hypothetical protein
VAQVRRRASRHLERPPVGLDVDVDIDADVDLDRNLYVAWVATF